MFIKVYFFPAKLAGKLDSVPACASLIGLITWVKHLYCSIFTSLFVSREEFSLLFESQAGKHMMIFLFGGWWDKQFGFLVHSGDGCPLLLFENQLYRCIHRCVFWQI